MHRIEKLGRGRVEGVWVSSLAQPKEWQYLPFTS